jgi:hypothetical protein
VFGFGPRLASERLRVAEALAGLPAMTDALASGELCWSAVRELTRVAAAGTEAEWIAAAREKSMRDVEEMVAGRRPGDRPGDPADMAAKLHVLRLEISGDALAAFREARRHLELDVGHSLDDDEAVRMLAHYALGGPSDPGRSAYQVAMTICEECGRGTRDGAGRELVVEPHQVEAARCDAQHIGHTHVGSAPAAATQTIPPRIRRLVHRRAHGRCEVDGCRSAKFLEIHHIVHRADGGTHDPSLLSLVCSAHHAAIHRGALQVSGTAPDHLAFRRSRATGPTPSVRTASPSPRRAPGGASDLHADALDALRRLGFSAAQARQALAASSGDDLDTLLRQALALLHPRVKASRASEPTTRYGAQSRRAACSARASDSSPVWITGQRPHPIPPQPSNRRDGGAAGLRLARIIVTSGETAACGWSVST